MWWGWHRTPEQRWMGGIGWMIGGLVIMIWGAGAAWEGFRSRGWPTAEGTVTVARVTRESREPTVWFSYQFLVNGHSYESSRYDTSGGSGGQEIVAANPVGTRVLVHYDPADPARSVLVAGLGIGHWLTFGAGIVVVVVGWWQFRTASSEITGEGTATGKLYRSPRQT